MPKSITNDKIFDLLTSARLEQKNDMQTLSKTLTTEMSDLRRQFETLEAGRLTRLEGRMNDFVLAQSKRDSTMQQTTATLSAKFVIIYSIIGAIFVAIITAFFYRVIVGANK